MRWLVLFVVGLCLVGCTAADDSEDSGAPPARDGGDGGPDAGLTGCMPDLTPPLNGRVDRTSGMEGDVAIYTCDPGYVLTGNGGSNARFCQADRTWSGSEPSCEAVSTPCDPNPCLNGGACTEEGETFTCDCTGTGHDDATCTTPILCGGAVAPVNGTVSATTAPFRASVTYACNTGYTLEGASTATCQADGTFSAPTPTCRAAACLETLSAPSNGSVDRTMGDTGDVATYSCSPGYALRGGDATRTCLPSGAWSGTEPECACSPDVDLCGDGVDQDCDGIADDDCNIIFATSTTVRFGTLGAAGADPLAVADNLCNDVATAAGLPGTFVAYLSTSSVTAVSRLGSARGFVRTDGRPVADTAADVAAGRLRYPVALTETGDPAAPHVGTGAGHMGGTSTWNCMDYTTVTSANVSYGSVMGGGPTWHTSGAISCNTLLPLYCVSTEHSTPLAPLPRPEGARLAFVSSTSLPVGGGVPAADDLCASNAASAGLAGTFVALLATSGASATSRLVDDGAPVVRPDGVVVASSMAAFAAHDWLAPINVTAAADAWLGNWAVWLGAHDLTSAGTPDSTCNDYMSAATDATALTMAAGLPAPLPVTSTQACSFPSGRIICIEP